VWTYPVGAVQWLSMWFYWTGRGRVQKIGAFKRRLNGIFARRVDYFVTNKR
jgi:hypothetical protein